MLKKITVPIFILTLILLVLVACSESEDDSPPEPSYTFTEVPEKISYDVGESWKYTFYTSETEFGFNTYEVIKKGTPEGRTVYTFESQLNLESSSACKPTNFDTTYRVDSSGMPERFDMSGKIGKG